MKLHAYIYRLLLILIFGIILVFLPTHVLAANGANAGLTMPASINAQENQTFNVPITINTDGADIRGVDVFISFDTSKLQLTAITPTASSSTSLKTFVPVNSDGSFNASQQILNANSTGRIKFGAQTYDWSANALTAPYNGSTTLAVLQFRSLSANGTTPISFIYQNGSTTSTLIASNTDPVTNLITSTSHLTNSFVVIASNSLSGTVYIDTNGNGIQDAGESAYSGATISLDTGQSTMTDSSGNYTFSGLSDSSYTETLTVPSGYNTTTTNPYTVSVTTDTTVNFGIQPIPTPTNTPTPTPTAILTPTPTPTNGIIWSADMETGDLSQWDGVWNSGTAQADATTLHAHSGTYGAALTITNVSSTNSSGTRLAKDEVPGSSLLPDAAYYSVWYYFPQNVSAPQWWNVFQWKKGYCDSSGDCPSDPVFTVNVGNRGDGSMYLYLYDHVGTDGTYNTAGQGDRGDAIINLPLNTWVHLECYYKWALTATGEVACWQDGQQIWDATNLITDYNYTGADNPRQWTVNNYSDNTVPVTQTIYVDDAAISTVRLSASFTPTPAPDPTATPTQAPTATPTRVPTMTSTPTAIPTPVPTHSLSGTVYNDANSNGIQDTGEKGYSGAAVTLNTGQTTTTDINGDYMMTGLMSGTYVETLTIPTGYTATTTNPVSVPVSSNTTKNFGIQAVPTLTQAPTVTPTLVPTATPTTIPTPTLVPTATPTRVPTTTPTTIPTPTPTTIPSATPTPIPVYTLSGNVYTDLNSNGIEDGSETGHAGVVISLSSGQQVITNSNGNYTFTNLRATTYTVSVQLPENYQATTANPVTIPVSVDTTQNFGIAPVPTATPTPTSIPTPTPTRIPTSTPTQAPTLVLSATPSVIQYVLSGVVYDDTNGNGVQDESEAGHNSVTVTLDTGQTVTTDVNGHYAFTDLTPGSYTMTVTAPVSYSASTDNPVTISLASDTTQNFGIEQISDTPTPTPNSQNSSSSNSNSSGADSSNNSVSNNNSSGGSSTSAKAGDLNDDGKVDIFDLSHMLSEWGSTDSNADLNHDGRVNIFDLSALLSDWGK